MKESYINANIPLYIAVKICSKSSYRGSTWFPLPMTKDYFCAMVSIVCNSWDDISISTYETSIPGLFSFELMDVPFAVVNHLAARLNMLDDEQAMKLTAIMSEYCRFESVEQIIGYTYSPDKYTLIPDIHTYGALGRFRVAEMDLTGFPASVFRCIDHDALGREATYQENGVFTPHGYVSSKDGWRKSGAKRRIPALWDIKNENGEDLYGERYAFDTSDFPDFPEDEMELGDDD